MINRDKKISTYGSIHHQGLAELPEIALSRQSAGNVDLDLHVFLATLLGFLDRLV